MRERERKNTCTEVSSSINYVDLHLGGGESAACESLKWVAGTQNP